MDFVVSLNDVAFLLWKAEYFCSAVGTYETAFAEQIGSHIGAQIASVYELLDADGWLSRYELNVVIVLGEGSYSRIRMHFSLINIYFFIIGQKVTHLSFSLIY